MLSTIAETIRDLLIFVGVASALLLAFIVVVSMMPNTNPLKRLLAALCYRLGATLAAGAAAIPLEAVPGIDLLYDIGVPLILVWYWFTFFRDARRVTSAPLPPNQRGLPLALDKVFGAPRTQASDPRRCSIGAL